MTTYNIEKYLRAKEAKDKLLEKIERLDSFIKEQEDLMDATFSDSLEPEQIDLGNGEFRAKIIGNSIDTDTIVLDIQTALYNVFNDVGLEIYNKALAAAETVRTSYNRTKFLNALKVEAKERALDVSGIISAAEKDNSQKTIKTKTIKGK